MNEDYEDIKHTDWLRAMSSVILLVFLPMLMLITSTSSCVVFNRVDVS